jgi:hypothetical protein
MGEILPVSRLGEDAKIPRHIEAGVVQIPIRGIDISQRTLMRPVWRLGQFVQGRSDAPWEAPF